MQTGRAESTKVVVAMTEIRSSIGLPNVYADGTYLQKHPTWHAEDSAWKADKIVQVLQRNKLHPQTICEVGCGAGEILRHLQLRMPTECTFTGYEISPQAFELCRQKQNEKLSFKLQDFMNESNTNFDLILVIDVLEHLENYFDFLRNIKPKGTTKIFHIPLDASVEAILRTTPIAKGWNELGHIHLFSKTTALKTLEATGYQISDYFYTMGTLGLPAKSKKTLIAKPLIAFFYAFNQNIAVELFGGSLLILAK
jgi:SAM-dependent methyltransferase